MAVSGNCTKLQWAQETVEKTKRGYREMKILENLTVVITA